MGVGMETNIRNSAIVAMLSLTLIATSLTVAYENQLKNEVSSEGLPIYGWTYDRSITYQFYEQQHIPCCGIEYSVYAELVTMSDPLVHIAVYQSLTIAHPKYTRVAEGYYNPVSQTFNWT